MTSGGTDMKKIKIRGYKAKGLSPIKQFLNAYTIKDTIRSRRKTARAHAQSTVSNRGEGTCMNSRRVFLLLHVCRSSSFGNR